MSISARDALVRDLGQKWLQYAEFCGLRPASGHVVEINEVEIGKVGSRDVVDATTIFEEALRRKEKHPQLLKMIRRKYP